MTNLFPNVFFITYTTYLYTHFNPTILCVNMYIIIIGKKNVVVEETYFERLCMYITVITRLEIRHKTSKLNYA